MASLKLVVILFNLMYLTQGLFKFSNVKCTEYDKSFGTIPICWLKILGRGVVALDLQMKVHKLPISNAILNAELFKKANGYRPFLYNITQDFCEIMRHRKKYPHMNIILGLVAKYSNINHTCPYNHDIIIKHLVLKDEMFQMLPVPQGEYLLNIKAAVNNDWKVLVQVYVTVN